jgi:hypothetical protein
MFEFDLIFNLYFLSFSFIVFLQYQQNFKLYDNLYLPFKTIDHHKRKYIIKNIIKAQVLEVLSYLSPPMLLSLFFNYKNYNNVIKIGAIAYVSNDFVALLYVDKLPYRTKYHHIVTTFLCISSQVLDFYNNPIAYLMLVYTFTSCLSYNVNKFLALRFLQKPDFLHTLRKKALYTYVIACTANWAYHVWWAFIHFYDFTSYLTVYYLLICVLIYDDLFLMNWLFHYDINKFSKISSN